MSGSRDHLEMSFMSIQCFTDDGKLDAEELGSIMSIAERDGVIDENEIRVLRNIISGSNRKRWTTPCDAACRRLNAKSTQLD